MHPSGSDWDFKGEALGYLFGITLDAVLRRPLLSVPKDGVRQLGMAKTSFRGNSLVLESLLLALDPLLPTELNEGLRSVDSKAHSWGNRRNDFVTRFNPGVFSDRRHFLQTAVPQTASAMMAQIPFEVKEYSTSL